MTAISPSSQAPAPPRVALDDVVAVLGNFPALSGVNLHVRPQEIVLLKGPNGAGKTSLLKVCAGLLAIRSGSAFVLGQDLSVDRRSLRREVGFLGHAGLLYDDLTVEDNIRFAVRASRGDVGRLEPVLEQLGLSGRLRKLPLSACSAGQRRRTSLAAVVVRQPRLWLLDEPHASLDAESRNLLDAVVREAASTGATVLLASHDDERAQALASRTVTIVGGHVVDDTSGGANHAA